MAHGAPTLGSPGEFNWLGRAATGFFVSPADDLVGLLLIQQFGRPRYYQPLFRNLVYQARH
ncbi:hypothetical protein [Dactylosporangium sp. NPDC005555]|uniref:hypothetical protein n=1 Tax=Dactylosporangium sp. NPDC005555 TaxID=3154889 RepID=UPI0033B5A878